MALLHSFSAAVLPIRLLVLLSLVFAAQAHATDIVREPMHGYWVGYINGNYINTLFQNWTDAAAAICEGAEYIHSKTNPPSGLLCIPLARNGTRRTFTLLLVTAASTT